jgi:hypothetical protein
MLWAFSKQEIMNMPLLDAISSAAIRHLAEFAPLHLSNTAWSFATYSFEDQPFMESISAAALSRLTEFGVQENESVLVVCQAVDSALASLGGDLIAGSEYDVGIRPLRISQHFLGICFDWQSERASSGGSLCVLAQWCHLILTTRLVKDFVVVGFTGVLRRATDGGDIISGCENATRVSATESFQYRVGNI